MHKEFEELEWAEKGLKATSEPSPEEAIMPEYIKVVGDDGFALEVYRDDNITLISFNSREYLECTVTEIGENGDADTSYGWVDFSEYNVIMK